MAHTPAQPLDDEWVEFPGGELEGKRPKALCAACRERLTRAAAGQADRRLLCFQCYRAGLDRERAMRAAGQLDTASEARFQFALPFEPVNRPRLDMLKADRVADRTATRAGVGRLVDRRRHAQITARHALHSIGAELRARQLAAS